MEHLWIHNIELLFFENKVNRIDLFSIHLFEIPIWLYKLYQFRNTM